MRELSKSEIDQLDFSGRIPDLHVDDYQLIGLVAETPMPRKQSRKSASLATPAIRKKRLARTA